MSAFSASHSASGFGAPVSSHEQTSYPSAAIIWASRRMRASPPRNAIVWSISFPLFHKMGMPQRVRADANYF